MSREKQIEEMKNTLYENRPYKELWEEDAEEIAEVLYNAGYRKQSEGEWLNGVNGSKVCSMCGKEPLYTKSGTAFATTFYKVKSNYCPNCGAKMRKEDEGK